MTWGGRLRGPTRRAAAAALEWGRAWAAEVGSIGPGDRRGRRFGSFGRGSCLVFPQGVIYNEAYIHVGEGTIVGPGTCLSAGIAPGQVMATNPVVRIGDRCVIGRGSHLVGHFSIELGDDIQTGPYVYITDQNHSYEDPVVPIGVQWPVEAPVRIGSGSWLGASSVVLPGADIGEHVVVAAGAVVRGRVPGHCVVAGVPARIVRRWVSGEGWMPAAPA
jgi:acetyltransferase-like isoleucine patch superfamily enzyme